MPEFKRRGRRSNEEERLIARSGQRCKEKKRLGTTGKDPQRKRTSSNEKEGEAIRRKDLKIQYTSTLTEKPPGHWIYPGGGSDATLDLQRHGRNSWRSRWKDRALLRVYFAPVSKKIKKSGVAVALLCGGISLESHRIGIWKSCEEFVLPSG